MPGNRIVYRNTSILLVISFAVAGGYSLSDPLKWINSLFLIGLLFLVVAGAVTVWKGGFFRVFVMGFRRQFGRFDDEDGEPATDASRQHPEESRPWIIPACFIAGGFHIALSVLLLYLRGA